MWWALVTTGALSLAVTFFSCGRRTRRQLLLQPLA